MAKVVIIGGGVIGCSLAYHLQREGVQVAVIERNEVASEASGAAAGLLSPLGHIAEPGPLTDLLLESWSRSLKLIPEIEALSGIQVEYQQTGALRLATAEDEIEPLRAQMAYWRSRQIQAEWLTGDELRQREPLLGANVVAGVSVPGEGSVNAGALTRAYMGAARKLGAVVYEHTEVTGLTHSKTRVTSVQAKQGETIACEHLVIAAGAWSVRCAEWLGFNLPITPMYGQMLSLRQPEVPLRHILAGHGIYLTPKLDTTIFVGATTQQVGFDRGIRAGDIATLLQLALKLAPALASAPIVKMWTGLRPWSLDTQPILGNVPGWENVTLATGHSRSGLQASAITGQALASLIITGQTPEIIRPFGIERFVS